MNELRNYPVLGWFEDVKFHEIDVLSVYFNRFFDLSIKLNLIESELYGKNY